MTFPANTDLVRVFGTYVDAEGKPRKGFIIFKPSVIVTGGDTVVIGEIRVPLDSTGHFSVEIPASINDGLDPDGWPYEIIEMLYGGNYRRFRTILQPTPAEQDIASLAPLDGTNYQPLDADLTAIAALDSAQSGVIASDGAGWIRKTYAALKTALGLTKADVGLGNVDNTSDLNKPVSTATSAALSGKSNTGHTHTKSEVGLGNVDNTSDLNKPVSTATATALSAKVDKGTLTTKGDGFVFDGTSVTRFPVGANGTALIADDTTQTGWRWGSVTTTANMRYRGAWAPSTVYAVNDIITFAGSEFVVTTGFTSGTSFGLTNLAVLTGPVERVHVA
jgi:hypothetical protein